MSIFLFLLVIFIGLPTLGWYIGKGIGTFLFPDSDYSKYIDRSVHHHYHDNRKININGEEFKSLKK